jgi:transcriptional regulator with XRE-family HTH domain
MDNVVDLNPASRRDKKSKSRGDSKGLKLDDVRLFYRDKKNQLRLSEEIRARLRKRIDEKQVTLDQIAQALDIPKGNKSIISHLLNGRMKLGLFQLLDLSSVLDVDIRELLYGESEEGGSGHDEVMHGANFEGAWQYISAEVDGLDANDARTLALEAAKSLGKDKVSEQEIRREVNRILVNRIKAAGATKSQAASSQDASVTKPDHS